MKKLPLSFYDRDDVIQIAKELLGKLLVTKLNDQMTVGRIVETEAYQGVTDKASHAYGGRRTARNEVMYGKPGFAYVYLCYGIHYLFNVVTNKPEVPEAILIRGLEPLHGVEEMMKRRNKKLNDPALTRGPGSLSAALGITRHMNGKSLKSGELYIADDHFPVDASMIGSSPRIGIDYAEEAIHFPYRFYLIGYPGVSGKPR